MDRLLVELSVVEHGYQAVLAVLDGASVVEVASRLEEAPDGAPMAASVTAPRPDTREFGKKRAAVAR